MGIGLALSLVAMTYRQDRFKWISQSDDRSICLQARKTAGTLRQVSPICMDSWSFIRLNPFRTIILGLLQSLRCGGTSTRRLAARRCPAFINTKAGLSARHVRRRLQGSIKPRAIQSASEERTWPGPWKWVRCRAPLHAIYDFVNVCWGRIVSRGRQNLPHGASSHLCPVS